MNIKKDMGNYTKILCGDAAQMLRTLPACSVHTCVTSPPYWMLRDYGIAGQIGLEATVEEFLNRMVDVFAEVWRVLRDDGTCWVNLGDTYTSNGGHSDENIMRRRLAIRAGAVPDHIVRARRARGQKPKDLIGIPWRVAFALQDFGWYLRQDIIWHKLNPMPESVRDRCTKAHEYIFLLSKQPRYYFDKPAMQEPVSGGAHARGTGVNPKAKLPASNYSRANGPNSRMARERIPGGDASKRNASRWNVRPKQNASFAAALAGLVDTRNKRSVWSVATHPYRGAHFATFPPALIRPCILASAPVGGIVLDPFAGSGTTGAVAIAHKRRAILIEINPDYIPLIKQRLKEVKEVREAA
jgi:site-specific DNA-methyltransferase (adenine-specific)